MEFNTAIFCGVKMKQERREKNIPTLKKWVNEWMECETFHILSIVDTKSFFFSHFEFQKQISNESKLQSYTILINLSWFFKA